ncbi:DoxX family protein [Streptomyces sp. NPDC087420]|uniref:DoxX family protein n=1 Tax=Streptomyces sp. NPDC087420 TaxID=3365785 RepID=UPI0038387FD2
MNARLNHAQPYALGLFRVVVGLLFAFHGASSVFGLFGKDATSAGTWPGWYAAVIELVGGALILLGLGTRTAAFISSGSMAYAYFTVHQPEALLPIQNQGEGAAIFCWAFLLIVFTGPGAFALDQLFTSRGSAGAGRGSGEERKEQPEPVAA